VRHTPVLVLVAALVGATAGSLAGAVAGAGPAAAVWGAAASRPAAQLRSADVGVGFEVRTGSGATATTAPQVSPYAVGPALAAGPVLVDVVSSSSVPVRTALVVATGGVIGAEVRVHSCAVPWTGAAATATCSAQGGAVPVASTAPLAVLSGASAGWSVDLPARGRQHLRVTRGLTVVGATSLTATPSPLGGGKDRTLG
jgi:hypothetical protein